MTLIATRLLAAELLLVLSSEMHSRSAKTSSSGGGQGWRTSAGEFRARANLLDTLRRQEVERVGRQLAAERGVVFHSIEEGETVRGKLLGSLQLASGRFAMIEDGLGFCLVPLRPVIEDEVGREVMGVMRGGDVSWQLGRGKDAGWSCSELPLKHVGDYITGREFRTALQACTTLELPATARRPRSPLQFQRLSLKNSNPPDSARWSKVA